MTRSIRFVFHTFIFLVLTLLTQIGGVAYLGALLLARSWRRRDILTTVAATLAIYVALTFFLVPPLARQFGRVRVACDSTTLVACVLNRAYLRPGTLNLVRSLEQHMADRYPGSRVTVLEGSFPFFDGFPLPPHLSHHDGRKVDLAFLYRDAATGASIARGSPSPIGYFHYQQPRARGRQPCAGRIFLLRWYFAWLQPESPAWQLDEERTRAMVLWLRAQPNVARIFIEPHLADRLDVQAGKVRFQGCNAARHDDHLHVEVR